jgi:hypothetical protein
MIEGTTMSFQTDYQNAVNNPTPANMARAISSLLSENGLTYTDAGKRLQADRRTVARWAQYEITPKPDRIAQVLSLMNPNPSTTSTTANPSAGIGTAVIPAPLTVDSWVRLLSHQAQAQARAVTPTQTPNRMTEFMTKATPRLSHICNNGLETAIMECVELAVEMGLCFSSAEIVRVIRSLTALRFTHRTAGKILRDNWDQWAPSYVQVSRTTSGLNSTLTRQEVFVYGPTHQAASSYDFEV